MKISLYDNKLSNFFISLLDKVDNLENIVLKDNIDKIKQKILKITLTFFVQKYIMKIL
ncbi:hypothetical protein [Mesomycoplasma hyorhinis]|uniref:Uncharacterized protein n=1 Tax=Mesomycoplasma hyorhinis (strain MCLD) TaxID=936139 RepID=A0ABM5M4M7_MESHM|nr:hypothetical protein [Mesomycoplasma hyorhinis]AEC45577.1 hypothetical protein SRH_00020 [Mesomycoplasma hyorhinis MCLD]AEX13996.1 hypothetical protein MYM_0208 [Mesomycoplasma hyorhinis GDL-1]AHA40973.1 hypothetical protein Q453_0226 [Mesomycoplasma hyorhinis DBS 1050]QEA02174.1 hypothetical protein EIH16_07480 [Mesomycoplasma hyorhinis]QPC29347.1 hypothetical protein ISX88_01950 [Mesomycoplasma hyorhinis]